MKIHLLPSVNPYSSPVFSHISSGFKIYLSSFTGENNTYDSHIFVQMVKGRKFISKPAKKFFQKPGVCENDRGLRIEPAQWYLP
jgi:hypothetical protein